MSEQLPSDSLLADLREHAHGTALGICRVKPQHLLALLECAEIVQIQYLLLKGDLQMRALRALSVLEERS